MEPKDILKETKLLIENLNCSNTVFRSNHASNYLNLKGTLNKDKENLLKTLADAIHGNIALKEEYIKI